MEKENKTMDMKEKLVEIERAAEWFEKRAENTPMPSGRKMFKLAGEALREKAHGVTVQEWISVEDKLPSDRDWVLVWHTGYATPKKAKYKDDFAPFLPVFLIDGDNGNKGEVTHWQPMPQPPKGE